MLRRCETCLKEFDAKPSHVKMGWGKFCSNKCHHISMKNGKFVECDQCKVKVYKNNTKLSLSKSGKFFCGKSCQTKWRNKYFSGSKHSNWINGESTYRSILLKNDIKRICKRCQNADIRVLVVHHVDHNRKNYHIKNLIWLCRNCHFLIHYDKLEEEKLLKILII